MIKTTLFKNKKIKKNKTFGFNGVYGLFWSKPLNKSVIYEQDEGFSIVQLSSCFLSLECNV